MSLTRGTKLPFRCLDFEQLICDHLILPGSCSGNAGLTLGETDAGTAVDMEEGDAWKDEKENDSQTSSSVMQE